MAKKHKKDIPKGNSELHRRNRITRAVKKTVVATAENPGTL